MAWTYSDWVTYDDGAAKLTRFRAHLKEVSDALSAEMSSMGDSKSTYSHQRYLDRLMAQRGQITEECQAAAGTSHTFTRGVPQ